MNPAAKGRVKGRRQYLLVAALLLLAAIAAGLGVWQVKRLAWKQALIAQVDAATKAPPLDAATLPPTPQPALEYRQVTLSGHFEPAATTLVNALTELGAGTWEMVPLRTETGAVWINRGFLAQGTTRPSAIARIPTGPVQITGLLRASDPGLPWLRANRPAEDRWYYRTLPEMTRARAIANIGTAWFVDAKGQASAPDPIPGLTVLQFPNNHLQYALTWFALCGLCLVGSYLVLRSRS
jgi:surfeit locus 1 family protein